MDVGKPSPPPSYDPLPDPSPDPSPEPSPLPLAGRRLQTDAVDVLDEMLVLSRPSNSPKLSYSGEGLRRLKEAAAASSYYDEGSSDISESSVMGGAAAGITSGLMSELFPIAGDYVISAGWNETLMTPLVRDLSLIHISEPTRPY